LQLERINVYFNEATGGRYGEQLSFAVLSSRPARFPPLNAWRTRRPAE